MKKIFLFWSDILMPKDDKQFTDLEYRLKKFQEDHPV